MTSKVLLTKNIEMLLQLLVFSLEDTKTYSLEETKIQALLTTGQTRTLTSIKWEAAYGANQELLGSQKSDSRKR